MRDIQKASKDKKGDIMGRSIVDEWILRKYGRLVCGKRSDKKI
jgi:hypothetical protein